MRDWRLCANSQLSSISARTQVDKLAQDVGFETIFPLHLLTILCSKQIIILNKVYSLSDCLEVADVLPSNRWAGGSKIKPRLRQIPKNTQTSSGHFSTHCYGIFHVREGPSYAIWEHSKNFHMPGKNCDVCGQMCFRHSPSLKIGTGVRKHTATRI